jgi:hypothetical protein
MENVDVVGYPNEISGGFKTGLYFKGVYNSTFVNVNVIGYIDPGLSYPDNIMVGSAGWYMDSEPLYWSINNRWTDCDVSNYNTAWKVRGHHEGLSWVTCCPAFVGNAWDIDTTVTDTSLTPYFGSPTVKLSSLFLASSSTTARIFRFKTASSTPTTRRTTAVLPSR